MTAPDKHKSLRHMLVSYLSDRKIQVRFINIYSNKYSLPGGGPLGKMIGLIEYLLQSNDNCDFLASDLKLNYVDDLTVLELVMMGGLLLAKQLTEWWR